MSDQHQLDLFAQPPIPATTMPTTAPRPITGRTTPIVIDGLPHGATADLEILVVDAALNRTYIVQ